MQEAAHRSTFYVPYWDLPFADVLVPRQRKFKENMTVINDTLNELIKQAQQMSYTEDLEELQKRDYFESKRSEFVEVFGGRERRGRDGFAIER